MGSTASVYIAAFLEATRQNPARPNKVSREKIEELMKKTAAEMGRIYSTETPATDENPLHYTARSLERLRNQLGGRGTLLTGPSPTFEKPNLTSQERDRWLVKRLTGVAPYFCKLDQHRIIFHMWSVMQSAIDCGLEPGDLKQFASQHKVLGGSDLLLRELESVKKISMRFTYNFNFHQDIGKTVKWITKIYDLYWATANYFGVRRPKGFDLNGKDSRGMNRESKKILFFFLILAIKTASGTLRQSKQLKLAAVSRESRIRLSDVFGINRATASRWLEEFNRVSSQEIIYLAQNLFLKYRQVPTVHQHDSEDAHARDVKRQIGLHVRRVKERISPNLD